MTRRRIASRRLRRESDLQRQRPSGSRVREALARGPARYTAARKAFVEALRTGPSAIPPRLLVKRVHGREGIWELTWAPDGRATFDYGREQIEGEAHVRWRRIGDHSILSDP